jgi:F-type H+-transporting ATPase subunit delta
MIVLESKLARKYATAFLNVNKDECTPEYIDTLITFSSFISKNRLLQATLNLPSLPIEKKIEIVDSVAKKLYLSQGIKDLIFLLLKGNRVDLLVATIKQILSLYREKEKKYYFMVTTSHELHEAEKEQVISFIKKNVKNHITASFVVDKSLISGIKIEGNTLLWERSIARQLRKIEQRLLRQEER